MELLQEVYKFMVIDVHAHVSAPQQLWAYRALLTANRGVDGPKRIDYTDDEIRQALSVPEIGIKGHLDLLEDHGIDLQLISPRPFHLMHSEKPEKIIHWFLEEEHNFIHRQVHLFPDHFRGVAALPQSAGEPIEKTLPELERCIRQLNFVGVLLNPDPYENNGMGEAPALDDRYWYPLYEKLCELDVPVYIHATTSRSPRTGYSVHMINEESIAVLSLLNSEVFKDFPALKVIIPHGGGSIPYQLGRFDAASLKKGGTRFRDKLRLLYYDTVMYTPESVEFLIRTVGADRCLFGTECPGVGAVVDPETAKQMDDLKPWIENYSFLSSEDRYAILEGNARKVFKLDSIQKEARFK
jgi:predicted TIM-barrel fold metal-dependent hydrolase